jgi:hypothetical protein
LFPGLIAASTDIGLIEVSSVRGSVDNHEVGEFTPDVKSWVAFNPDSELIPVARANGIAYVHVVPAGGTVAGLSGVMKLDGWTWEEMSVQLPVAMHLYWPAMQLDTRPPESLRGSNKPKPLDVQAKDRAKRVKSLDDFFNEAEAYAKGRQADSQTKMVPAWEAMLPVLRGEVPMVVHADEARQIKSAVAWSGQRGYQIILNGGRDAAQLAGLLAEKKIPVIYSQVLAQPLHQEQPYDAHFSTPSVLVKSNVLTAIMLGGARMQGVSWSIRNLPYAAAHAMAFGLSEADALKSITLNPAKILRLDDRIGSLDAGKDATIIAVDGSILDVRANVKRMWIGGKEVSLESRHTRLYEKFRSRPKP